jgi:hypothetical protein
MRLAYVGLSFAMALYIIAQAVDRPVFFYALLLPAIVFLYGITVKETPYEERPDEEEETPEENDDEKTATGQHHDPE